MPKEHCVSAIHSQDRLLEELKAQLEAKNQEIDQLRAEAGRRERSAQERERVLSQVVTERERLLHESLRDGYGQAWGSPSAMGSCSIIMGRYTSTVSRAGAQPSPSSSPSRGRMDKSGTMSDE